MEESDGCRTCSMDACIASSTREYILAKPNLGTGRVRNVVHAVHF